MLLSSDPTHIVQSTTITMTVPLSESSRTTTTIASSSTRRRRRASPMSKAAILSWVAVALQSHKNHNHNHVSAYVHVPSTATAGRSHAPSLVTTFFRNDYAVDEQHHRHEFTTHPQHWYGSTTTPPPQPRYEEPPVSSSRRNDHNHHQLPTWLSIEKSHLSQHNLQSLQDSMQQSQLYTELETRQLLHAVHMASHNDDQLLAGAAEFVSILVHMELGYAALVAAAFHYTECVQSRRNQLSNIHVPIQALQEFGQHAVSIAHDAARLKQLEIVAAQHVNGHTYNIRSPSNGKDAENLRQLLLSETADWRGLAIRCAASLYRLRGLLLTEQQQQHSTASTTLKRSHLSPETIRASREALLIYAPLASRLGMRWLKNELENTAFQLLYRRQYETVQSYAPLLQSMQQVLQQTKLELAELLQHDTEFDSLIQDVTISARVKEPYSLWKKMLRNQYQHVLQVPDALALRIVLNAKKLSSKEPDEITRARERALCYYAQKLCTQQWKPSEQAPRFKDYIEHPKPNGYQSLHYTAQNEHDYTLEFQVRTGQMHQIAEFGLASHWDYKEQQKLSKSSSSPASPNKSPSPSSVTSKKSPTSSSSSSSSSNLSDVSVLEDQSSNAYLRKVQEWHWQQRGHVQQPVLAGESYQPSSSSIALNDVWQSKVRQDRIRDRAQRLEPYLTALTEAQSDLTRDYVFVFLTSSPDSPGHVLALPSGACVLDALREGEKAVGCPLVFGPNDQSIVVNGASTSVTRQLHNGDVLSLPHLCSVV